MTWVMTLLGRLPICWRLVIMSDDSNSLPANREAEAVSFSQWEDNSDDSDQWEARIPTTYQGSITIIHRWEASRKKGIAFKLYQGIIYSYSFLIIIESFSISPVLYQKFFTRSPKLSKSIWNSWWSTPRPSLGFVRKQGRMTIVTGESLIPAKIYLDQIIGFAAWLLSSSVEYLTVCLRA